MQQENYKSLAEINKRAKYLFNQFDFKNAESLERHVSTTRLNDIKNQIKRMLDYAPELEFILNGQSKQYAKEIFKKLQMIFVKLNTMNDKKVTNFEIKELVQYEAEKIQKMCVIIESDNEFKYMSQNNQHRFNKQVWLTSIKLKTEEPINVFFQDLDGGFIASEFMKKANKENDVALKVYGVDEDIKRGEKSRDFGINVARGGILETSKHWVDLAFVANTIFSFKETNTNYSKTEMAELIRNKLLKKSGILVFNYPFYKIFEIQQFLERNRVISFKYLDDSLGNLLITVKMNETDTNIEKTIQNLMYRYEKYSQNVLELDYKPTNFVENIRFRGKYTDLNDILSNEFTDKSSSLEFIVNYYKPSTKTENLSSPLVEIKPGHIPAIASSESVNGRYVDEIYGYLNEPLKKFDHIHSTKIVKREIEEEMVENKNGVESKLISVKKSNVIHSVVLTAKGEYLELFGSDTNGGEKN